MEPTAMAEQPPSDPTAPELTFLLWSWPWSRLHPRRFEFLAKWHGLAVAHEHDHGLLLRCHLLTVTGPANGVRRYRRAINNLRRAARNPNWRSEAAAQHRAIYKALGFHENGRETEERSGP
jgi:hypothetical protein